MERALQAVLDKTVDGKRVFGTSFALKKESLRWNGASGDMSKDQAYFIASTTKLFTTAIVLHLRSEGKLNLEDRISKYLDKSTLDGLHRFKGKEYAEDLTITQLLAHTSGLPDYFQGKGAKGISLEDELKSGMDQDLTFDKVVERTKALKPLFVPGAHKKANYSDTNFRLLGKIIENISDKAYSENCNDLIIRPLDLSETYLYQDSSDSTPKTLYYREKELNIPKAMASFGPDGGMVSTSAEMLIFIESFFTGKLFPEQYLAGLQTWNKIFFPMRSGTGLHMFKLPWIFDPTGAVPQFLGHSGLSGAIAFYSPAENLYVAGTVNQLAHPDLSFKTMIKLAQAVKKNS